VLVEKPPKLACANAEALAQGVDVRVVEHAVFDQVAYRGSPGAYTFDTHESPPLPHQRAYRRTRRSRQQASSQSSSTYSKYRSS